ncbi:MAG: hydrogenase maturation protease [Gammaproteobacteria bacterium]|nr:hydrogenase maturation protease [Gammaproteobacteria bacterium]
MLESKVLIVGVGNPYRHDDGIGIEIIKILQQENNPQVILFDAGTDGFSLLDKLALYKRAIIIDAVYMGEKPGEVRLFTPKEARLKIKSDALSTHGFGLAEVLKLAEELGIEAEIKIIGIEPESIDFGEGLSEVVKNQIPEVLDLVGKEFM